MAKSIHTMVSADVLDVTHYKEKHDFSMPEWFQDFGAEGVMMSEDKLVEVAKKHGILHGLLHAGLQQAVIGMRACCRPADDKDGNGVSMLGNLDKMNEKLEAYRPKPVKVPGASAKKKPMTLEEVIAEMRKKGSSDEEIKDYFMKEMAKGESC